MKKLIIPTLALLFFCCDKEDVKNETTSESAVDALQEYVTVSKVFQDIGNNNGDAVLTAEDSASGSQAKSTELTVESLDITISPADLTTFPKTITVDFGTGVLGKDGVTRKGIVTIFPLIGTDNLAVSIRPLSRTITTTNTKWKELMWSKI